MKYANFEIFNIEEVANVVTTNFWTCFNKQLQRSHETAVCKSLLRNPFSPVTEEL